jgi:hypothetical protein
MKVWRKPRPGRWDGHTYSFGLICEVGPVETPKGWSRIQGAGHSPKPPPPGSRSLRRNRDQGTDRMIVRSPEATGRFNCSGSGRFQDRCRRESGVFVRKKSRPWPASLSQSPPPPGPRGLLPRLACVGATSGHCAPTLATVEVVFCMVSGLRAGNQGRGYPLLGTRW